MDKTLNPQSKAATILMRNHIGTGYCAGPEFPGATIRMSIDKLYSLGFMADVNDRMIVTQQGKEYLQVNHLSIKS